MNSKREILAELAHAQWSGWMEYLFSKGVLNEDGTWTMPAWAVERWKRQTETPYADLSFDEKESDRKEADKFLLALSIENKKDGFAYSQALAFESLDLGAKFDDNILTMNQPMQPLAYDEKGVLRFKPNAIVQYILDNGGTDLNKITCLPFSKEDRQQFAQLIGYSLGGYSSLSYVDNESYETAEKIFNEGLSEDKARIAYLEGELKALRDALQVPMARLFEKHPDDLN